VTHPNLVRRLVAPQRLEDLVVAYNAAIDAGTLHLLSPPRRSDRFRAWPSGRRVCIAAPMTLPWISSTLRTVQ
jgi:hypothetical protein